MPIGLLIIETLFFGVAFWLGLYLISRDPSALLLRYAALGLIAYAIIPALDMLHSVATSQTAENLIRIQYPLVLLPATFWSIAMLFLLPDASEWRDKLSERTILAMLLFDIAIITIAAATNLVFDFSTDDPEPGLFFIAFALFVILTLGGLLILTLRAYQAEVSQVSLIRRAGGVLITAGLFFALGIAVLMLPLDWIPRDLLMLAVGCDLIFFGLSIAVFDSFAQGETLRGDMTRSFLGSAAMAGVFGGQIALMMVISTGITPTMLVLMLTAIAAAILINTQARRFSHILDTIAFPRESALRRQRDVLNLSAETMGRVDPSLNIETLQSENEEEFDRITRRALSNYGNLPRLATSPLTRLPLIEQRLKSRQASDNTLERANELKAILTESIDRLKPRTNDNYGITDEWRHYNVLYYPYVMGIKPFSRQLFSDSNGRDSELRTVLAWFQADVPQRTFYNWQNAAAKLVAQDLRERLR
jgi:hypothetical protein